MNPRRRRHLRARRAARLIPAPRKVHWCNWAGQPDIGIACGRWTTPAHRQPHKDEPYLDDHGALYAFNDMLVTCSACLVLAEENLRKQADEQVEALQRRAAITDEERAKGDAFVARCNAIVEGNNPGWREEHAQELHRLAMTRTDEALAHQRAGRGAQARVHFTLAMTLERQAAGHAALRAGDREAWQEDGEVSGGEAEDMSHLVATTEIERYIDDRLGEIQKAPRMHGGTPHEVDAVCYILLEMFERFCAERPVVLRDEYTRLSRALHPKCPASLGLVGWLCDTHGETKAMGLVVAFYLLLLARLREVA